VNFSFADLRFCKNLDLLQLRKAIINSETQLPSNLEQYREELLKSSKENPKYKELNYIEIDSYEK
jgi:hypothetical protein